MSFCVEMHDIKYKQNMHSTIHIVVFNLYTTLIL